MTRLLLASQGDHGRCDAGAAALLRAGGGAVSGHPPDALRVLRSWNHPGLRASELLAARLGDLVTLPEGLALKVHGKGARTGM